MGFFLKHGLLASRRRLPPRRRLVPWIILADLVAAFWVGGPVARPRPVHASDRPFVQVEDGAVSVVAAGASLDDVLREIQKHTPIKLVLRGARREQTFADFRRVPLDEALARLIRENFLLVYSERDTRALEVWIGDLEKAEPSASRPAREPEGTGPADESEELHSLVLELQEGDAHQRARAVRQLGESLGERALHSILRAVQGDGDPAVRKEAITSLETFGGQSAIQTLAASVGREEDYSVRQRAVEALAHIRDRGREPLTRVIGED